MTKIDTKQNYALFKMIRRARTFGHASSFITIYYYNIRFVNSANCACAYAPFSNSYSMYAYVVCCISQSFNFLLFSFIH